MAELNVFELTNKELRASETDTKSAKKPSADTKKKAVKESVKQTKTVRRKSRKPFDIPANKLQLESLTKFKQFLEAEGDDDSDVTAEYTADDDVVVVIDPEMDEVPEDTEAAEEAAEELVGQHVCKCSICGANYVTDAEINEDLEMEDEECPVCGETGEQIVVGVITPTEEISDEDQADLDDVDVDVEDDGEDVDVDAEFTEEDEDDFEESVKRSRAKTVRRKTESARRASRPAKRPAMKRPARKVESATKRPATKRPITKRPATKQVTEGAEFDEKTLSRMLTTFAKENYSNVKFVKISSGTVRGKRLTLEGTVTTTKGVKRPIKFVCENFVPAQRMSLKFREIGPFTESIKGQKVTFIVECVKRGKTIIPATLKYNFKAKNAGVRENKATYSVTGRVLSESVRRPAKRPTDRKPRPRRK